MAHKVVIGGFGTNEKQIKRVAAELSESCKEEFFGLSFRQMNADTRRLFQVTKDAEVYTHSAGFLAIRHTQPEAIHGLASPLAATSAELVGRAALCGLDATKSAFGSANLRGKLAECGRELITEVSLHAIAHLGKVATIAAFDAIDAGIAAQKAGIQVGLGFVEDDRLFIPSEEDKQKAIAAKLPLVTLAGGHLDFILNPVATVEEYQEKYKESARSYGLAA